MKRIIVLCDGTGQSASRGDESVSTNVNRIGHALSHKSPVQQLIYYQSGIGTEDLDRWSKMTAGIYCPALARCNHNLHVFHRRSWLRLGGQCP